MVALVLLAVVRILGCVRIKPHAAVVGSCLRVTLHVGSK